MTDQTTSEATPEQVAEARRIVAEADAAAAQAALDARAAEIAPIRQLVEDPAFTTVIDGIAELRASADINSDLFAHLNAAHLGLNGLKSAAA